MLSKEQFTTLPAEKQLQILQEIFSQLSPPQGEISDTMKLLQSGFPFQSETLITLYTLLYDTIAQGKGEQQTLNLITFKKIHQMLENEAKQSEKEADDLLNTIE